MTKLRRILVPIDFSPHADTAMAWAVDLARRYDASIVLTHVYQSVLLALPDGYVLQGAVALSDLLIRIDEALDAAKKRIELMSPGIAVKTVVRQGAPWVEIGALAAETPCDLIVIGTHGRTGLKHALLGSVAEKVVRTAPCPVLTVRMDDSTPPRP